VRGAIAAGVAVLLGGCRCGASTAAPPAVAVVDAGASADAGAGAGAGPDSGPDSAASATPFGSAAPVDKYVCPVVVEGSRYRSFMATADTRVAFVDGNDLLALVNRSPTGALPPSYAPSDLVDIKDLSLRSVGECDGAHTCLRKDAAVALRALLDAMKAGGMPGRVDSAFRAFRTQCWVFDGWAAKAHAGFCEATTQSALPGHSQHQLGTTVDMFTADWGSGGRPVFRDGFGCTPGGKWLDDNAWRFGFVLPYPIDPDDRKDGSRCATRWDRAIPIDPKTGYKHEPWHARYLGQEAASKFHDAWLASGPGTPGEITLEQWLRTQRGLAGDAELPVCDGCQCGACSTMAADGDRTPCGDASLQLDANGRVAAPAEPPHLVDASAEPPRDGIVVIDVKVHAPAHTPTQTPVTSEIEPTYATGATFRELTPYEGTQPHAYDELAGAWRVAIEPVPAGPTRWPWRASLARAELEATWNRANVVLPAQPGDATVHVRLGVAPGTKALRVTLLRDGVEHETREVPLP
jgi:D-alanyl-D-alanine carboxypeptidase